MRTRILRGGVSLLLVTASLGATAASSLAQRPATSTAAAPAQAAPSNVTPPTVIGKATEGRRLRGTAGSWSGTAPITFAYTWLRCASSGERCKAIAGAGKLSYKPTGADAKRTLELQVTAHNAAGASSASSKPTAVVAHSASKISEEIELRLAIALAIFILIAIAAFKVLIGVDGRASTSKTVAMGWTYLLASMLLGFVLAKFGGYPQGLDNLMHAGLEGQYGLLIGGPLGAAIAAKGIVGAQLNKDPTAKPAASEGASANPAQLVQNDAGETELGDFQYVLFNLVAMVFFVGTVFGSPADGLPHIPDVLLALTSVGAVGYVAKKTLPNATPNAKLDVDTAVAGTNVTISGPRLLTGTPPDKSPLLVLFGSHEGVVVTRAPGPAGGEDSLKVTVPLGLTKGEAVDVVVVTPAPSRISAGKFTLA
jgi:hypothetical protein